MALLRDWFKDEGVDVKEILRGQIWKVKDEYLSKGAKEHLRWQEKEERPVIVISSNEHNNGLKNMFIVIVPVAEWRTSNKDVLLPKGVGGTTKTCNAQITLFQGIPREAFIKPMGSLYPENKNTMDEIEGRVVELLGITA